MNGNSVVTVGALALMLLLPACDAGVGRGAHGLSASDNAFMNSVRFSTGAPFDDLVTNADDVVVTAGDIDGRLYQRLGDIRVRVYPESPDRQSTEERANDELRVEAASLGADAVIHVKYTNRTPTFFRGASFDATGVAVRIWRTPPRKPTSDY